MITPVPHCVKLSISSIKQNYIYLPRGLSKTLCLYFISLTAFQTWEKLREHLPWGNGHMLSSEPSLLQLWGPILKQDSHRLEGDTPCFHISKVSCEQESCFCFPPTHHLPSMHAPQFAKVSLQRLVSGWAAPQGELNHAVFSRKRSSCRGFHQENVRHCL